MAFWWGCSRGTAGVAETLLAKRCPSFGTVTADTASWKGGVGGRASVRGSYFVLLLGQESGSAGWCPKARLRRCWSLVCCVCVFEAGICSLGTPACERRANVLPPRRRVYDLAA